MDEIIKIKTIKIEKILFVLIILTAIIVRLYEWPTSLREINCDEAMSAINAETISEKGVDMYGTSFPVYFETWLYGGQSSALTYIMALTVKIFGSNIFAVRFPLLIFSLISLFIIYDFSKRIFNNRKLSLIILAMLAINPWHILQSIWSMDCNLFPHFMLLSTYSLFIAVTENKKWLLYISAGLFGLTMYTYGVSIYFIPFFLLITTIYLVKNKKINIKKMLYMAGVYLLISFPFYLMILVNAFKLNDIHIFGISIQYFKQFSRLNEMLIFSSNFYLTLGNNIVSLFNALVLGDDGVIWNCNKLFGPIYHLSLIFLGLGMYKLVQKIYKKNETGNINENTKLGLNILLYWFCISLFLGVFINETNVNRINIIWYPIIIISGYGFYKLWNILSASKNTLIKAVPYLIIVVYFFMFIAFSVILYIVQDNLIGSSHTWSNGLIDSIRYADSVGKDSVYIISKQNIDKVTTFFIYASYFDNKYINTSNINEKDKDLSKYTNKYHIEKPDYFKNGALIKSGATYIVSKEIIKFEDTSMFNIVEIGGYYIINSIK